MNMASKHLTPHQQNFTRLVIVCVDLIKLVLKDVLRSKIKPADLYNAISSCVALTSGRLRPEQQRLCYFPAPNVPDYNTFDVSLLYTLIRNLCPSLMPTLGWGNTPSHTAQQIGDDIERLRIFRNEVHGHCESSNVNETEFSSRWMEIESAIRRVEALLSSQGLSVNYEKEMKKIKDLDLGSEDMEKYKLLLEGMMCLLKKSENEDIPKILIHGKNKVTCGKVACFKVDEESSSMAAPWSVAWQRVRGDTTEQINISTEKYRGSNDRKLVIHRISKPDEGGYQAVLSRHNLKLTSNSIFLVAAGDPPVLQTMDVSTGLDGITLHYKYTVTINSPNVHHITWTKKGEVLCIDDKNKYIGGGIDDRCLTITSPAVDDGGQYTCIVANAVGAASQSLTLDVPSATVSTEVQVYVGSETKIDSVVSACPPPEGATWEKSSDSVTFETINVDNPKYYGSKRDPSHPDLVFTKATFNDRLYYRLLVWNKIGQCISNTVYLNVTGGPPNISNSHETNIQNRSITLTCEIFLYGNSPRMLDVCWMKDSEVLDIGGSGGKLVGGNIGDPSLVINNVNEFDAGSYQCKASNAVGSTFGNVIILDFPDIEVKEHLENDTKVFTAVLTSIPAPMQVQWSVKNEDTGYWTPVDINSEKYKGSTDSLPLPVLVVNGTGQIKPYSFQIEVKNFIGIKTKQIPDKQNLRLRNANTEDCKGNILKMIINKKGSSIRFNNLLLQLIKEIPVSDLTTLKRSLKVMTTMEISLDEVTSIGDFVDCLLDKGIVKERDVTMLQYLLRSIERPDLELDCAEYARRNRQALCYYEEKTSKEEGFVQVKLHVVDDIEQFTEMDSLLETLAAVLGCESSCIKIDAVKEDSSFIIVLLVEAGLANLLLQKDPEELKGLLKFNVDWIEIEKNFITIPQKSKDLNIEFRKSYDDQISKVLAGPCTSLFRTILRKYVPETYFLAKIKGYKKTLLPALDDRQRQLLYPERGSFSGSYRNLDLPILYILLQSICGIKAHQQGWGNPPNSIDLSLSANIDRIMEIHVMHGGDAPRGVPKQTDFDKIMKKVIHISGKIEEILKGSRKAVGARNRGSMTIHDHDKKKTEIQVECVFKSGTAKSIQSVNIHTTLEIEGSKAVVTLIHDHDKKKEEPQKEYGLEALTDVSFLDEPGFWAKQISSITVTGVDDVYHISVVTSDRLWVSGLDGRLLQVDSTGHVLNKELRVSPWYTGSHTVTKDGDLLFIDDFDKVCKFTPDGTVTILLTTDRGTHRIYSSCINSDILVGSDFRVKRYNSTGRELQVIERDDKGQRLYESPMYITENKNGDILISDVVKRAVVVVDKSGRHRFDYTGRQSDFSPRGICTDVRGHVLVCDAYNHSVYLLDQDGQFLILLLTPKQCRIHYPTALCVDDQHNLYLGQRGSNTIDVYKYLQDKDVK